jgi:hypothetical protein
MTLDLFHSAGIEADQSGQFRLLSIGGVSSQGDHAFTGRDIDPHAMGCAFPVELCPDPVCERRIIRRTVERCSCGVLCRRGGFDAYAVNHVSDPVHCGRDFLRQVALARSGDSALSSNSRMSSVTGVRTYRVQQHILECYIVQNPCRIALKNVNVISRLSR